MNTERTGIALVGTGMAAGPHARALRDLSSRLEVRGVYSREQGKREAFAAEYGFPAAESLEALAADKDLDVVIIATPPNARADLVRLFAGAGKQMILEKPLERTLAAAREIVAICAESGVRLGTVFQYRYRPAALRLKQLVREGALGRVAAVRVSLPWWRGQDYYDVPGRGSYARDGGGVLISQAIHSLDLMLEICGSVNEVRALAATSALHKMEAEDFVAAGLQFAAGMPGALIAATTAFPGAAEIIALDCEKATAELQSEQLTLYWKDGKLEHFGAEAGSGGGADPMAFSHAGHRALIEDFIDAWRENRPFGPSGRAALSVQGLIEALIASSGQGRAVNIPPDDEEDD